MEGVPNNLESFNPDAVPSENAVGTARTMKLFFYGLLAVVPAVGITLIAPALSDLSGTQFYAAMALVPLSLLMLVAALFAYMNKMFSTKMQQRAAYQSLQPVLEALPEQPRTLYVAKPSFAETFATGVSVREFAMEFPSAPYKMVYFYDGAICSDISSYLSLLPFKGLRVRISCPLKRDKPGRYERIGSIYLPKWGFSGETEDLQGLRGKVGLSGLKLLDDEPEPSRIEFDFDEAIVVLSLRKGDYESAGKAVQKALELCRLLKDEGVTE